MDMDRIKSGVQWFSAIVIGVWEGIPALTQLLLILMAADLLLRVLISVRNREISYRDLWDIVTRKTVTIGFVSLGALLQPYVGEAMGINLVQAASVFYIVPELLSIVKGAGLLQVPVPHELNKVISYFDALNTKNEAKETSSGNAEKEK